MHYVAHEYNKNTTKYTCDTIDCKCIPDEMLCGKDGSIGIVNKLKDISYICILIFFFKKRSYRFTQGRNRWPCIIWL